jgi:phage terminase small subunit
MSKGEGKWGPAMSKLTERQRRFVFAMILPGPGGDLNQTAAAAVAGYIGDRATLQVTGSRLYHDQRIRAAMLEEGLARAGAAVPVAVAQLVQIAQTSVKETTRLKAISMILNRAGMPETTQHMVSVTKEESEGEKVERAIKMAKELGLDPKALLGRVGITIDAQANPSPARQADVVEAQVVPEPTAAGLEDLLG